MAPGASTGFVTSAFNVASYRDAAGCFQFESIRHIEEALKMIREKFTQARVLVTVEAYELSRGGWPYRTGFEKHAGLSVIDYSSASSLPSAVAYDTPAAAIMAGVCAVIAMLGGESSLPSSEKT
jgi:hypothetical protein